MTTTARRTKARPLTKAQTATVTRFDNADAAPESANPNVGSMHGGPDTNELPDEDDLTGAARAADAASEAGDDDTGTDAATPAGEAVTRPAERPAGALAVHGAQQAWSPQQLEALSVLFKGKRPGPGELTVYLNYAQRTGLDPFAKQIYMVPRWNSRSGQDEWTIQTGIDGMRVVAQRSGEYAGQTPAQWCGRDGQWVDVWLADGYPAAARIGVRRAGFPEPLYAVARWDSYYPGDGAGGSMWRKMPDVMIAKVAEALALRKAFPQDLSGIYTSDEMAQADAPDVVQSTVVPAAAQQLEEHHHDEAAVLAEVRCAAKLAVAGERVALVEQWKVVKQAGLSTAPVEFAGGTGTLGDLIVFLGGNIGKGAELSAQTWLDANPEDDADESDGDELPADTVTGEVVSDTATPEPALDPWAKDGEQA